VPLDLFRFDGFISRFVGAEYRKLSSLALIFIKARKSKRLKEIVEALVPQTFFYISVVMTTSLPLHIFFKYVYYTLTFFLFPTPFHPFSK